MDELEEQNLEQAPECIESKLACDLAMIPVLGVLFYVLFENIAIFKLGSENASKSFWLREGVGRLWIYTFKPFFVAIKLLLVCAAICLMVVMYVHIGVLWTSLILVLVGYTWFGWEFPTHRMISQILLGVVVVIVMEGIFVLITEDHGHSNDNAAQAMLKSVVTAQATYTTQYKRYAPSLAVLASSGILQKDGYSSCTEPGADSAVISGYIFQMTAGQIWTSTDFYVRCRPISGRTGTYCYTTDTKGKIVSTETYQ